MIFAHLGDFAELLLFAPAFAAVAWSLKTSRSRPR